MLTIFALYVSYSGDDQFMLRHFSKAEAIADLLMYRYVHCMCGLWSLLARRSAMCCESEPGSLSGTISRCRTRQLTLDTASPLEVMKVTSCIRLSHSGIPSPSRAYPHTTANAYFVSVVVVRRWICSTYRHSGRCIQPLLQRIRERVSRLHRDWPNVV